MREVCTNVHDIIFIQDSNYVFREQIEDVITKLSKTKAGIRIFITNNLEGEITQT
jgi:hypothetical protein